jgi:glycosyltransferase involved in cell wall biosynthesis
MKPLVTLAVPTFNRTTYLREALTSVLAQDYPNLDILISDNGSHNQTPEVARSFVNGDPRVRFRRNELTLPIYDHFNQLIRAARGEFFLVVCDDDIVNPTFVSELVGVATRHAGINVVVPTNVTIDEQGAVLKEFARPDGELLDGVEFASHWLHEQRPPYFACLATMLLRTEAIRHFGGYPRFARGQSIDNMLFLQCAMTGPVGFAHRATFSWRIYPTSFGTTTTPQQIAQSSHEMIEHIRSDRRTVDALTALPPKQRAEVIHGVRLMSANAFLYSLGFYTDPGACFRKIFAYPLDTVFVGLILRHYAWWLRNRILRRRPSQDTVQASAAPLSRE